MEDLQLHIQGDKGFFFFENALKQLGSGVGDFWLIMDISRSRHRHDPSLMIRVTMASDPQCSRANRQDVECGEISRLALLVRIEFPATRPRNLGVWFSAGSSPSSLPVCPAST